ncbi:hypothetical protein PTSG_03710 [Salpingoeca rosetta]|uniref:C2H2-type domain-containing protein n=1 Tax=Salpingoeca rosetta (strain ATCC 50818 / BSB-021) TaxID=946362 RepID=F2U6D1_SALR5|nr:uncharacterized protein PTSG_03710 [Salpingoeca rosetta]EGD83072.1 hypothetical protein PTSG_03710 [Salpingoeca rosetta]|eukprot:XP_004995436.1 hypothetical protein PTSG_03710 [Salpingoeca rosetta]
MLSERIRSAVVGVGDGGGGGGEMKRKRKKQRREVGGEAGRGTKGDGERPKYACRKCRRVFMNASACRRHALLCGTGVRFACSCSHTPFASFEALRLHARRLKHDIPEHTQALRRQLAEVSAASIPDVIVLGAAHNTAATTGTAAMTTTETAARTATATQLTTTTPVTVTTQTMVRMETTSGTPNLRASSSTYPQRATHTMTSSIGTSTDFGNLASTRHADAAAAATSTHGQAQVHDVCLQAGGMLGGQPAMAVHAANTSFNSVSTSTNTPKSAVDIAACHTETQTTELDMLAASHLFSLPPGPSPDVCTATCQTEFEQDGALPLYLCSDDQQEAPPTPSLPPLATAPSTSTPSPRTTTTTTTTTKATATTATASSAATAAGMTSVALGCSELDILAATGVGATDPQHMDRGTSPLFHTVGTDCSELFHDMATDCDDLLFADASTDCFDLLFS